MRGVIVPNTYIDNLDGKVIFLAGPIRLAGDWHSQAIEYILGLNQDITIVSPKRIDRLSEFSRKNIIEGDSYILNTNKELVDKNLTSKNIDLLSPNFSRQRDFELYYLEKASENGCVMFWLPGQEEFSEKKAYGAMTRLELGENIIEKKYNSNNGLVIGTDGNFPEVNTIKYDINRILGEQFPIYNTLEETCDAAIKVCFYKKAI